LPAAWTTVKPVPEQVSRCRYEPVARAGPETCPGTFISSAALSADRPFPRVFPGGQIWPSGPIRWIALRRHTHRARTAGSHFTFTQATGNRAVKSMERMKRTRVWSDPATPPHLTGELPCGRHLRRPFVPNQRGFRSLRSAWRRKATPPRTPPRTHPAKYFRDTHRTTARTHGLVI
jgi:hypothetical protein